MNITERRRDCTALPKGWQKEDVIRKTGMSAGKVDVFYYSRADTSLVPPIRQTASIFKQPVTLYRSQETEGNVKKDHGTTQDKPKQLFWEKRLEGLRACDTDGTEIGDIELPKRLRSVGPNISEGTLLQSIATSLHINSHPVTGQSLPISQGSNTLMPTNTAVFLNPEQPLMQMITISEDDIKRQEERVQFAREKLRNLIYCEN